MHDSGRVYHTYGLFTYHTVQCPNLARGVPANSPMGGRPPYQSPQQQMHPPQHGSPYHQPYPYPYPQYQ